MNCPNCHKDVEVSERNYGALYTCPQCQAVYFLNFDGTPEYSQVNEAEIQSQLAAALAASPQTAKQEAKQEEAKPFAEQESQDAANFTPDQNFTNEPRSFEDAPADSGSEVTPLHSDGLVDFAAGADPAMAAFENPLSSSVSETNYENPLQSFANVAKDISDFGNTDVQISALNYDLEISGLDSKEEYSLLKEAISDSRFGWDESEIIKRAHNGVLRLQKLNPVQAYVLMKRLHLTTLELKWTQHVLE